MIARLAVLVALVAATPAGAADKALATVPFWKASAGWWQSENTYFDGALNYNIRSYNSLVHVTVEGDTVTETEEKFYAPSKLAQTHGAGQTGPDEGVEVITTTVYARTAPDGAVQMTRVSPEVGSADGTVIRILARDTALRVTPDAQSGVDTYRMFITLPTPDKRYKANFGIVSQPGQGHGEGAPATVGDLRGFSLFRETRVGAKDVDRLRGELLAKNKVRAVVTAGPDNKPSVRRLD